MLKNPKVSILVPICNVERYLRECLNSLVNQTLREIEIICINDGSTDSSLSIIREYERRDERIVVIDIGEGPIVLINPEIIEKSGEQTGDEGCLSVPGMAGQVTRPNYVKVKAQDEDMNEVEYEGEGLLARAFCHELDHLDGHMYTELVEGELHHVSYDEEEE